MSPSAPLRLAQHETPVLHLGAHSELRAVEAVAGIEAVMGIEHLAGVGRSRDACRPYVELEPFHQLQPAIAGQQIELDPPVIV
jgi:hypothetical protein